MLRRALLWILFLGVFIIISSPVMSQITNDKIQKIFLLGRSLGVSYYHLIDLSDKSKEFAFTDIKKEYQDAFQNLNITDLIIEDLNLDTGLSDLLKNVRLSLYNALNKQDLSETKLAVSLDKFTSYYEELRQKIKTQYTEVGSWLLDLGFYTSFQLESIYSKNKEKLFLSGFNQVIENIPLMIPENIAMAFLNIRILEKPELTTAELTVFQDSLIDVTQFFSTYPEGKREFNKAQELVGNWSGILLTPECERRVIKLKVNNANNKLTALMDIEKIAANIHISNIDMIDGYFTFMFKPFGTEKLYIKFDAKLSDKVFSGEIVDVLGEKGYWVLAKGDQDNAIEDKSLDIMSLYIKDMESKLKVVKQQVISVSNTTDKPDKDNPIKKIPHLKEKIILKELEAK
ncbi:MAG: hypothetical protein ACD_20C00259G0016 [uncultured bacterium]|nr:MAG: hypothetical protein ACD_20C00259G0016 [uncultured bacterium]HCB31040.1 hypothetical protein [Acinetobacter lwoffii]